MIFLLFAQKFFEESIKDMGARPKNRFAIYLP